MFADLNLCCFPGERGVLTNRSSQQTCLSFSFVYNPVIQPATSVLYIDIVGWLPLGFGNAAMKIIVICCPSGILCVKWLGDLSQFSLRSSNIVENIKTCNTHLPLCFNAWITTPGTEQPEKIKYTQKWFVFRVFGQPRTCVTELL